MLKFINNYPLSNVTTLQIGGAAKKFVKVATQEELTEAVKYANNQRLPYLIIGGGSNLLVADEGVNSLVIKNEITGISTTNLRGEIKTKTSSHLGGVIVKIKSGTPLQQLVDNTINNGLSGLQKLAGIPGTVGGAVYGNAGAYGQTISDHLTQVTILNTNNLTRFDDSARRAIEQYHNSDCVFAYRDSVFKRNKYIILEVIFQLESGNPQILREEAQEVLAKRLVKYPPGIKCPGSFFKNLIASEVPAAILKNISKDKIVYGKIPAGILLEEVGAKGQRNEGIEIAPYHANLFINTGKGTAKDFYNLAKIYAEKVKEKFGITLEPEVQLINLPPMI